MESDINRNNTYPDAQEIIDSIPLFIKIILCITIILYLLNPFIPFISWIFANIPYYTIIYLNIWRLITTPFITTNILSIIFSIFFWYKEAVKIEKEIGTVKYMLVFLINSFFIQIIYTAVSFLLWLIMRSTSILKLKITDSGIRNDGLWPILLCDLTLLCLSNPEKLQKFYFFRFSLKAKYYPLVLLAIFTIISGFRIDLEILCGIGYGFLYHYHLKKKLLISDDIVKILENSPICKWMTNIKGFIHFSDVKTFHIKNNIENIKNSTVSEIIEITQNKIKNLIKTNNNKEKNINNNI